MKKKLISTALCLAIVMTVCSGAAVYAAGGDGASVSNFKTAAVYKKGTFADVGAGAWYDAYVQKAYELGIMNGKGSGIFEPEGNIRVGEAIKMACVVHNIYHGGTAVFAQGAQPWYRPYVDYAQENGLLGNVDGGAYDAYIDRGVMAYYFSRALPESELAAINTVETLPDVREHENVGAAVFQLYRAGVLTGSDSYGTFEPDSTITRAQAAAIITRLVIPSERRQFTLHTVSMTAEKQARLSTRRGWYNTAQRLRGICDQVFYGTSATAYFYDNGLILLEEYADYNPETDGYAEGAYHSYWYCMDGELYCIVMTDPNTELHLYTLFFSDGQLLSWEKNPGQSYENGYRWDEMQGYYAHAKAQCDWVSSR